MIATVGEISIMTEKQRRLENMMKYIEGNKIKLTPYQQAVIDTIYENKQLTVILPRACGKVHQMKQLISYDLASQNIEQ